MNKHAIHATYTLDTDLPFNPLDYRARYYNGFTFEDECTIVGLIYEMIEEAVSHKELDEDYASILKLNPEEAMRWLEDNEGITVNLSTQPLYIS